MSVAIDDATQVYGDRLSIIKNIFKPESKSNKKSKTICNYAVSE